MRILDKYILKSFIGPFLFGVFAFTSIFVGTGTLFRIAQFITEYGASLWSVTKIFFLALPAIVVLTFPMSTLLGSLMTFGRLSGNSEIVVMRAGGQPFIRLALPIYILCFFISIGTTLFNEYVVPASNHAYQTIVREEIKKEVVPRTQNNIVLKQIDDGEMKALMYAAQFDNEKKELTSVTVQEFDKGNVTRVEHAHNATWEGDSWVMHDGTIYDLTTDSGVKRTIEFKNQIMPLSASVEDIHTRKVDPEEMTIKELRAEIRAYQSSGVPTAPLELELYSRFSIPLASFVFALVGACLGLQPQRSSSSMGFGISVLIIFIYYGVMTLTQAFGKGGVMSPMLAAFFPDILALAFGIYLNWRATK